MAMLNRERDTRRRDGREFSFPVAAGTRIFAGAIVAIDANGYARPANTIPGLRLPALAAESVDRGKRKCLTPSETFMASGGTFFVLNEV